MEIYQNHKNIKRGNCSTVIIGKNVSSTHNIIMGHNEDDEVSFVQSHLVPRKKHSLNETITFEDSSAILPQTEETLAFYWSEVKCEGGISFADSFVNECGVAIVSDSCRDSREADEGKEPLLAYALRRLVAERAHSAREGVKIAAELIETYGYCSSRTYHIVDKDEAWCLAVPKGFRCVAKRIQDDEIYFIPNHFVIHQIDFNDTDNYYASNDIVSFAVEHGWMKEDEEFDFAKAYQENEVKPVNYYRSLDAWKKLADIDLEEKDMRVDTFHPNHKYGIEDVKVLLRSHGEGSISDSTHGNTVSPHHLARPFSICNQDTIESLIFVFHEDIHLLKMYRAFPKPCLSPYIPWYPLSLTQIPEGYAFSNDIENHFCFDPEVLKYHPEYAWHTFKLVQTLCDLHYPALKDFIHHSIQIIEEQWDQQIFALEKAYKDDYHVLQDFTISHAKEALTWAYDMIASIMDDQKRKELLHQ